MDVTDVSYRLASAVRIVEESLSGPDLARAIVALVSWVDSAEIASLVEEISILPMDDGHLA
jgi:hypothetical protein